MKFLSSLSPRRLSICLPLCMSLALPSMSFATEDVKSDLEHRLHFIQKHPQDADLAKQIASARENLKNYQVVFVTGFFGREIVNYFTQPMDTLKEYFGAEDGTARSTYSEESGITTVDAATPPAFSMTEIRPTSMISTMTNADTLYKYLLARHAANAKPIILVAHSKGGAETFYALLKYPDLIKKGIVSKAILLNAALGGSEIADQIGGGGIDPVLIGTTALSCLAHKPEVANLYDAYVAAQVAEPPTADSLIMSLPPTFPWGGLFTMRRSIAHEVMANLISHASPETIQQLNQHVFYARAYSTPETTSALLECSGLKNTMDLMGKNDGVLMLREQCIQGIGQDLGTIQHADHGALVSISKLTNGQKDIVESFTKTLFTSLSIFPELRNKPGYDVPVSIENPLATVTTADPDSCTLIKLPKTATANP